MKIYSHVKKFALLILIIFVLNYVFIRNSYAQQSSSSSAKSISTSSANISDFQIEHLQRMDGVISYLHIAQCIAVGDICFGPQAKNIINQNKSLDNYQQFSMFYREGLLGVANNVLIATYSYPPASLGYTISKSFDRFIPIEATYAQSAGLGFTSLSAFSSFWSVMRNIAYSFLIVVLAITGFLLIFRYKIDPNTSVDLEKIIGKTIIVVLAITFSYAIAGFLIDLMYVSLLVVFTLAKSNNLVSIEAVESIYSQAEPGEMFLHILKENNPIQLVDSIYSLIPISMRIYASSLLTKLLTIQSIPEVASGLRSMGTVLEGGLSFIGDIEFDMGAALSAGGTVPLSIAFGGIKTAFITYGVLIVAVAFGLLFLYFRILFLLVGSYIEIVFSTIFAPLIIIFDIFPGKNYFSNWVRRLVANIIVFPLLAIFLIAGTNLTQAISSSTNIFLPPPLSGMSQKVMSTFVGLGVLMAIPSLIDRVKKSIIPDHALVNFPSTPTSLLGTMATILPFVPYLANLGNIGHAFGQGKEKNQPGKTEEGSSHLAHLSHGKKF